MSIPTPAPFMAVYPQSVRPVANVTPFTYRDGLSYLNLLESLIDYVNTKLVGYIQLSMDDIVQQLNTSIEELSQQIASNEVEYNKLLDDYMSSVEYRIMEINNKSGQLPIRRYQVTDDMVVDVEPVWPDRQQIVLQFTQDYLGHVVEFKSTNEAPSPLPDATNGWTSTSSQWWPGRPDINAGRRPDTNGYVTRRDISGPSSVISRIENIGGINIPARHGREHTVSVYTHCTTTDDYTVQLHVSTDVDNFDSPKLAAAVDEQGWARTVYTFTMPTTTDVLNVSATVELADGQSAGGEEVWWTDAQVEQGDAPTAYRGVFANPYDLKVSRTPLVTTQIDCTPQPDGSWILDSIRSMYQEVIDRINDFIDRINKTIADFQEHLDRTIDDVYGELDKRSIDMINVLGYGGVDNTGVKDSTQGIQDALDDAEGKEIIFPEGDYRISDTLEVRANTRVTGHNAKIIRDNSVTGTMFANYKKSEEPKGRYDSNGNILMSGMIFDGGPERDVAGNLTTFSHARDITIRDCHFMRCTGYHHVEFNAIENGLINNCIFEAFFPIEEKGLHKEAIQIDCANSGSIGFGQKDGTPSRYITVSECVFREHPQYGGPIAEAVGTHTKPDYIGFYDHINIVNNTGLRMLYSGCSFRGARRLYVAGNNFSLVDREELPSWGKNVTRWVIRAEDSTNSTIMGNIATGFKDSRGSDNCIGVNGASNRCRIIGNNVIDGYSLLYVGDGNNNVVANNTVNGKYFTGIRLYKADLTIVQGNQISGSSGNAENGIFVNGADGNTAYGTLITGNIIEGNDIDNVINVGGSVTTAHINNNLFRGGSPMGAGIDGSRVVVERNY